MAERMNITDMEPMEVVNDTRVLIGMRKKSDNGLFAMTEEEYQKVDKEEYAVDGIIIRNEEKYCDILVSLSESENIFSEGPDDIPETDKRRKSALPNPTFDDMNGNEHTQWWIEKDSTLASEGHAIHDAIGFGWLPSCGEMQFIRDNIDTVNSLMSLVGGTAVSDSEYWTSAGYSADYMWHLNMATKEFSFWRSKKTSMKVRPVKNASEYVESVKE